MAEIIPVTAATVAPKIKEIERKLVVLYFGADWAPECQATAKILETYSKHVDFHNVVFLMVDVDKEAELAQKYQVEMVPTFVFYKNNKQLARLEGHNPPELSRKLRQLPDEPVLPEGISANNQTSVQQLTKLSLQDRLKALINRAPVILFMKGSPDAPQCGFSRTIVGILREQKVPFDHFDILTDDEVRQGLKAYSNWPTYPQLYAGGELIGGLDVIKELIESGDFMDSLPKPKTLDDRLKELVAKEDIMLFMKGDPASPQCKFSRATVALLASLSERPLKFGHFDILSDEDVRQGLKAFSNWPTFPQLYVKGEFIGGLDIMKEMHEGGELGPLLLNVK